MLINGLDAQAVFGFFLAEAPGWRDIPAARYATLPIPGRPGAILQDLAPVDQPRKLSLTGVIIGASAADARAKLDQLAAALRASTVRVTFDDHATREYVAIADAGLITPPAASLIADMLPVQITLTCLSPYAREINPTSVTANANNTDYAIPLGTAPVRPVLTWSTGPVTNPTVTLKSSTGAVLSTLTLTITTLAGDSLVLDCDAMTLMLNGASVLSALTGGDFFALDAATQGNYRLSSWPKLRFTGFGSGAKCTVTYRKLWR